MLSCIVKSFGGNDSRGASAPSFTITVQLCNCSGNDHGSCDWSRLQNGSSASDSFQIVVCNCVLYAFEGTQILFIPYSNADLSNFVRCFYSIIVDAFNHDGASDITLVCSRESSSQAVDFSHFVLLANAVFTALNTLFLAHA